MLTAAYLNAFQPAPVTGTLFGPSVAAEDISSVLITDGHTVEDLQMTSIAALEEAQAIRSQVMKRGGQLPLKLPPTQSRGHDGWFLESLIRGDGPVQAKVRFTCPPAREVVWDLRHATRSSYTVGFGSKAGDISQTIQIDARYDTVVTDHYFFQIRSLPFSRAVELALAISATIYTSGQYNSPNDLGGLKRHRGNPASWIDVPFAQDRFRLDPSLKDDGRDQSFVSERSLFHSTDFHEPVFEAYISDRDTSGMRDLSITMYRPPDRLQPLMPLSPKLVRSVWAPIYQRIQLR